MRFKEFYHELWVYVLCSKETISLIHGMHITSTLSYTLLPITMEQIYFVEYIGSESV